MAIDVHEQTGTTIIFSVDDNTYESGYTKKDVGEVIDALKAGEWVSFDSSFGEVFVNPLNVQYVQPGRRAPRRTTASPSGNVDHQRLVGGQGL